jgi:lipoic acid synthetase
VIAHNVETVPRLYAEIRPEADYLRSLEVLNWLATNSGGRYSVKSSIMVGLGEETEEVLAVLTDLAEAGCSAATLGQYLPPSKKHQPVKRFYTPEEFSILAEFAKKAGIPRVASGPLVRSSYMAHELAGRELRR